MAQLSPELIAKRALQIVDNEGLAALSMRRLGNELMVDAKAVYYYYGNKSMLLDAVLKLAFSEMKLPAVLEGSWQHQLRIIATAYYRLVSGHPHLLPYLMRFDGSVPIVFDVVERIVAALQDTGLTAQQIIQIIDLFWSVIPSFAIDSSDGSDEYAKLYEQLSHLSEERFPATKVLLENISIDALVGDLDFQIDLVIKGIESLIADTSTRLSEFSGSEIGVMTSPPDAQPPV